MRQFNLSHPFLSERNEKMVLNKLGFSIHSDLLVQDVCISDLLILSE